MVSNLVGPVARGENCFGRDDLVNLLGNRLRNGNVLLAAPRRFGKTSVMYRLIDAPRPGYRVIHGDLEHMAEPADFNRLMTDLENDFYVRFDAAGRRFQFACSLLRDWWLRHYAMEAED